jgi:hypothetical protein
VSAVRLPGVEAARGRSHPLHALDRQWPETNCFIDVWIELLPALGCEPLAALPFTVLQDFEGDHFGFFKFPVEDLRVLFGLSAQELAIWDSVEGHTLEQVRRGNAVLIEVDSWFLPDTQGSAYRREHTKTTIAVGEIDVAARRLGYFHNLSFHALDGEDYEGVFRLTPPLSEDPNQLFPYVEFVKRERAPLEGRALVDASIGLLRAHLKRRPKSNPIAEYRIAFPAHMATLNARPIAYFHTYAFNTVRQLGANFEMLGSYLDWLAANGEAELGDARAGCAQIALGAKSFQFQLARIAGRKREIAYEAPLRVLEATYDAAIGNLSEKYA